MITVTITTSMEFLTEDDLNRFLNSSECKVILGFPDEIQEARRTGKPYVFTTQRPKFGAVVRSDITVLQNSDR